MTVQIKAAEFGGFYDWDVVCDSHGPISTCSDWDIAMEAAWGHIAMHHRQD